MLLVNLIVEGRNEWGRVSRKGCLMGIKLMVVSEGLRQRWTVISRTLVTLLTPIIVQLRMWRECLRVLLHSARVVVVIALTWCLPTGKGPSKIYVGHLALLEFEHHSWVEHRNAQRCTSIDSLIRILKFVFFIRFNLTRPFSVIEQSLHEEFRV